MSDWEIDNSSSQVSPSSTSDWEIETPSEEYAVPVSYSQALAQAPSKIWEDVTGSVKNFLTNIPRYYEAAKTEVPGVIPAFKNNPLHAARQLAAGLPELGQKVFNTPHDVINYLSQRLNLIPQDINRMVQMGRMPEDTQQAINQYYGTPNQPGEKLLRGIIPSIPNAVAVGGVASLANPLRYTSGGIAKNVLRETDKQILSHNKKYNKIWKEADKSGFNDVPYDRNLLQENHYIIDKFYPEKSTISLKTFLEEPRLETAQGAQSDLGQLRRSLEEKSRTTPLLESEKLLHKVIYDTEKHIENNMFKNSKGEINQSLKNKYKKVTNSYRKNVVPYRYNPAIQAYKAEELTAPELVNALSRGAFARQKGWKHPAIKINQLSKSKAGWLGAGAILGKELFGAGEQDNNQQY